MTELAAEFLAALDAQGYEWHLAGDDLVIEREGDRSWHMPVEAIYEPRLRPILVESIDGFAFLERGRFYWDSPGNH